MDIFNDQERVERMNIKVKIVIHDPKDRRRTLWKVTIWKKNNVAKKLNKAILSYRNNLPLDLSTLKERELLKRKLREFGTSLNQLARTENLLIQH
ncbi:MAG: hypothetical protein COW00_11785 [Bdellovibrio sp. CG12_big_fil_rev_8_21_14_0_65_39_13]|nr:MAG: hypothetical protein COW78_12025 [Bdellovibrio sp. CG22_combo_CG10-13_8_21_14_all_39_27]PIQ59186.1 MAG: hypothetical protein COW00_11785 [Bdellovibrio sp. CG12_big_fil_rev_8_21_14_0_65_39_13]PIR32716.1 MAG: hypothetical protein COV37_18950 [Bdellovibrio sp. CG11_big_fil_rev_8_21_14_0_20_39_38]